MQSKVRDDSIPAQLLFWNYQVAVRVEQQFEYLMAGGYNSL